MICFLWLTLLPHVPPDFRLEPIDCNKTIIPLLYYCSVRKKLSFSHPSPRRGIHRVVLPLEKKWFTYTRITVPTKRFWFLLYKQKSLSTKLQLYHSHITYYFWYKIKCNSDDVKTRQFIYARNPGLRGGGEGGLEQRRKTSEQSVLFCVDSSGVFGFLIS